MMDSRDFDLWADGYDRIVGVTDDEGKYPFAGYKVVLNEIYNRVLKASSVFLNSLLTRLNEGGCIYIGDVAFDSRIALQKCMNEAGDEWDDEEEYFVFDELKALFPSAEFEPMSCCAGIITLRK